ncbi:MAG: DUF4124 domain-containing protein [Gammaproteobacteria bacterium]|nr:DUF4124 domain-containing protein [Gammaproteobacteria bacterium]
MFKTIPNLKNLLLSGMIAIFLLLPCAYAGLNKWVDEKGQVHYGDRVPSEYLAKEHSQLNEQGVILRTSKALKTEEELSAEESNRKIKAAEDKKRLIKARKQALRDRVLLDTFTRESDLSLARDARIEAIDSQISLAETLIKNDEKKLAGVKGRIDKIEKSGRVAPENLHKEVLSVGRQIQNNYAFIEDKTNERNEILETFKQDISRFRQLKKERSKALEKQRGQ